MKTGSPIGLPFSSTFTADMRKPSLIRQSGNQPPGPYGAFSSLSLVISYSTAMLSPSRNSARGNLSCTRIAAAGLATASVTSRSVVSSAVATELSVGTANSDRPMALPKHSSNIAPVSQPRDARSAS